MKVHPILHNSMRKPTGSPSKYRQYIPTTSRQIYTSQHMHQQSTPQFQHCSQPHRHQQIMRSLTQQLQIDNKLHDRIQFKKSYRQLQLREIDWRREVEYINRIKVDNERIYKNKIKQLQTKLYNKQAPSNELLLQSIKQAPSNELLLQSIISQQKIEVNSYKIRLNQFESQMKAKQDRIISLIEKIEQLQFFIEKKLKYVQFKQSTDINHQKQAEQNLQKLIKQYGRQKQALNEHIERQQQKNTELQTKIFNMEQQLQNSIKKDQQLQTIIIKQQKQIVQNQQNAKILSQRIVQVQLQMQAAVQQIIKSKKTNSKQCGQQCQCHRQLSTIRSKLQESLKINEQLDSLQNKIMYNKQREHTYLQIQQLRKQNYDLQEQIKQNQDTIFILERTNASLRKQILSLNQYIQSNEQKHEQEIQKYKFRMKKSVEKSLQRSRLRLTRDRISSPLSTNNSSNNNAFFALKSRQDTI